MLDAKPISRPLTLPSWQDRAATAATLAYCGLALGAVVLLPVLAFRWLDLPLASEVTLPYLTGLIYLFAGLWVLWARRQDPAGRALALFAASAAVVLAGLFDLVTTRRLTGLWGLPLAMMGAALFNLALLFPQEARMAARHPSLRWLSYPLAGLLALNALTAGINPTRPLGAAAGWRYEVLFATTAGLLFLGTVAWRRFTSPSPVARAQARTLLWGLVVAVMPLAAWLGWRALQPETPFWPYLWLPLAAFPLAAGYAVLHYRLLNTDYLLSRAFLYGLLSALATLGYVLLAGGLGLALGGRLPASNPFLVGFYMALAVITLLPIRDRLQTRVDRIFFRGRRASTERLQRFRHDLTHAVELPAVIQLLRQHIEGTLAPTQLHLFVFDPLSGHYEAAPDESGQATSDLRFAASSALAQTLSRRGAAFFMDRGVTMPRALQSDWARMALLGAQLFIPLPGRDQLAGWLSLGPRQAGEPYSDHDLSYLEALNEQAALAIERAQVVADLERRVREMNVLTRVAQGVNITLAFDDILELIYAQSHLVIPLNDFHITLTDKTSGRYYHAFFVEADERLSEQEHQPLPERQGLAGEVIRSGRALITPDHGRECRARAILPVTQGLFAWMGIPLNAGAETIGALSLGSREAAVVYTSEQRDLLQAIADQAAGAIAKARLLQESERRARQLATLNEVASSLASTLELEPLLDRILQSAVEILNCEAGSLLLVDESSGELVFQVTNGPVASDLVGQRLPPGTGLVGKAADTGQPLIANDVQLRQEWFNQTDERTGFLTRSVLVVPLRVKETTIAVIEVINKRDGLPFLPDDQELLTVFTGQAAVAIENARLYTLTDQALAARVGELSVMQRIDRELNASLEVGRAMQITLDWALRQSGSEAGFVGMLAQDSFQLMAAQGYPTEPQPTMDRQLILGEPAVQAAIQSGNPQVTASPPAPGSAPALPDSQSRVAIPIRREAEVVGIMWLESLAPDHYQEEMLNFLDRLSDHAAIAISNAQLYAEVQAANIAKSDFVSFVSHELKTPMTSIKGYADLLATGAVGPVSEAQANFLSTIRSNVNRMATLVSDLADISRIEAGRLRLEFSAVAIPEVVEEVVRSTHQQFEEKEQILSVEIPADLPPVWGDRNRLIQILTNLMSNASKYTPGSGKITVRAKSDANQWDPHGAPEVVHLSVEDTGIGMTPEDQQKIFQKFFRSEDQKVREVPGTGLGLSITKNLVEMQEGRIWFESQFRVGTTFHFTVPIVAHA